jgi:hypothetical protein
MRVSSYEYPINRNPHAYSHNVTEIPSSHSIGRAGLQGNRTGLESAGAGLSEQNCIDSYATNEAAERVA